jgi:hypothetical protein
MAQSILRASEIGYVAASPTPAAILTNPSTYVTYCQAVMFHNNDASDRLVKLYNVPDVAGSVGTAAASRLLWQDTITAGAGILVPFGGLGLILQDTNDTLQAEAAVGSQVTAQVISFKELASAQVALRAHECQFVANTPSAVVTNPVNYVTYITGLIFFNSNTSTETLSVHNVPDSSGVGSPTNANKIPSFAVDAGKALYIPFPGSGLILEDTNDTLQIGTTTSNKVTVQVVCHREAK